jgi:hypothetical protein
VFENRVLRKIFGHKRDKVTAEWRRLHIEEHHDLTLLTKYYSGDQINKNEMGGACGMYGSEGCIQDFGWET